MVSAQRLSQCAHTQYGMCGVSRSLCAVESAKAYANSRVGGGSGRRSGSDKCECYRFICEHG